MTPLIQLIYPVNELEAMLESSKRRLTLISLVVFAVHEYIKQVDGCA